MRRAVRALCVVAGMQLAAASCPNHCNGHGRCDNPSTVCNCDQGYIGGDCSERARPHRFPAPAPPVTVKLCRRALPHGPGVGGPGRGDGHGPPRGRVLQPGALALPAAGAGPRSHAVAARQGICDRTTGRCACQLNFVGAACERSASRGNAGPPRPTGPCLTRTRLAVECSSDCNGHGECRSIGYHLERLGYVYNRWDRDQLYGCHCDDGYEGFDCSLRECPVGDDPMTTGQANEVQVRALVQPRSPFARIARSPSGPRQVFQCNADTGTFTLSFEEHTTAQIDATAGTADVKSALEALPNIRADSIAVAFSSGTEVCDSTNQPVTSVTFTQNFQPCVPRGGISTATRSSLCSLPAQATPPGLQRGHGGLGQRGGPQPRGLHRRRAAGGGHQGERAVLGPRLLRRDDGLLQLLPQLCDQQRAQRPRRPRRLRLRDRRDHVLPGGDVVLGPRPVQRRSVLHVHLRRRVDGRGLRRACVARAEGGMVAPPHSMLYLQAPAPLASRGFGPRRSTRTTRTSATARWPSAPTWASATAPRACAAAGRASRALPASDVRCPLSQRTQLPRHNSRPALLTAAVSCPFNEDGICSGHGQCLNMASLAKVSAVDAQATDFTYGATPNDEATWDYDKVHGCFCDAGYEGYDCSLRTCRFPCGEPCADSHAM